MKRELSCLSIKIYLIHYSIKPVDLSWRFINLFLVNQRQRLNQTATEWWSFQLLFDVQFVGFDSWRSRIWCSIISMIIWSKMAHSGVPKHSDICDKTPMLLILTLHTLLNPHNIIFFTKNARGFLIKLAILGHPTKINKLVNLEKT